MTKPSVASTSPRIGRRAGLSAGSAIGLLGCLVCALAIAMQSFWLLCAGTTVFGASNAFGQYYRFAAADASPHDFKARAISIKEERSHMVKDHLWVLWTDYFKAPHFEKYPQLHQLFNEATKLARAAGTKGTVDVAVADQLLAKIDEIAEIFAETKKA